MKIEDFFNQQNVIELSFFNFENAITAAYFARENLEIVKKIATLYWFLEDWQRSLAFYEYGLSLSPDDVFLQKDVRQVRKKMQEIASREAKG